MISLHMTDTVLTAHYRVRGPRAGKGEAEREREREREMEEAAASCCEFSLQGKLRKMLACALSNFQLKVSISGFEASLERRARARVSYE